MAQQVIVFLGTTTTRVRGERTGYVEEKREENDCRCTITFPVRDEGLMWRKECSGERVPASHATDTHTTLSPPENH